MACTTTESFGQNVQSVQNPECLYPQPVWPFGNNGNLATGTLVQGSSNTQLNATSADNVFQQEFNRKVFSTSSNAFVNDPPLITGTVTLPTGFYSQTGTNTVANALAEVLNAEVVPQISNYISQIQGTLVPTGTSYAIQLTATTLPALIPDQPVGNFIAEATNGLSIQATGTPGTLQKMANGCLGPILLTGNYINGFQNSTTTGTFSGATAGGSGDVVQYCGVNTQAALPDFNQYADIQDAQTRSNQFNSSGLTTLDGSSNQGQPPWVFLPGQGTSTSRLPENICSNADGLGNPGSEGLTYLKPIAGQCAPRPSQDVCQNPCIRDPDSGKLKPNPQTSQCRVFPGLSDANSGQCPTVCPQQCIEMWETCPPGTGMLTTLLNAQDDSDVLALQGPFLNDNVTPNPQFPSYRNGTDVVSGPWPNPNRSYKECQAAGTNFCSLALGNLQTQPTGSPICSAPCPNGFQNINAFCTGPNIQNFPNLCTAGPFNYWDASSKLLGPFYNGAQICVPKNGNTPNIVCDPNYFAPYQGYLTGHQNTIQGCATVPIPILTGTTCSSTTNTWVNELFSVEQCTNACPANYLNDITQLGCVSSCSGAVWDSSEVYLEQWDQYDYYLTTGRCAPGAPGCSAANQPGSCPQQVQPPVNSAELVNSVKKHGSTDSSGKRVLSKVLGSSLQDDLPQNSSSFTKKQWQALRKQILDDQSKSSGQDLGSSASNQQDLATCPEGMEFVTVPQNGEVPGLCQDKCQPGFKPVRLCVTSPTDITVAAEDDTNQCPASKLRQGCLPDCPPNWDPDNSTPGVNNCTQRQPGLAKGLFPGDPGLWVSCPEDGRFIISASTNTALNAPITQNGQTQGPPMCVRKPQERLSTCPINFQENPQNQQCTKLCGEQDIVVQGPSGTVCARACSNDGRFYQQQESLFDPNVDPNQINRQCQRLSIFVGSGSDPNTYPTAQQTTSRDIIIAVGFIIGIVTIYLIQSYFTRGIRK